MAWHFSYLILWFFSFRWPFWGCSHLTIICINKIHIIIIFAEVPTTKTFLVYYLFIYYIIWNKYVRFLCIQDLQSRAPIRWRICPGELGWWYESLTGTLRLKKRINWLKHSSCSLYHDARRRFLDRRITNRAKCKCLLTIAQNAIKFLLMHTQLLPLRMLLLNVCKASRKFSLQGCQTTRWYSRRLVLNLYFLMICLYRSRWELGNAL